MPRKSRPRRRTSVNLKLKRKYGVSKVNYKRYAIALSLFVLSLGFLFSLSIYRFVTQNLASALSPSSYSIVADPYPTISYIVVDNFDADPINVLSANYIIIDKASKKIVTFDIPLDLVIDIPGRFGEEEYSKVFSLGALSENDSISGGIDLMNKTIFSTFGFKPDKFLVVTAEYKDVFDSYWGGGELLALLGSGVLDSMDSSINTDLSVQEFFELNKFINSLPSDRFIHKSLDAHYIDSLSLLDEEIRDITFESVLALDKKDIAVLNGTDQPGAAAFGARVVKNMGGRVVAVGNSTVTYDHSKLVVDDMSTDSVRELSHVFEVDDIQEKRNLTKFEEEAFERADIVLIVGFDFAKNL